jgi:hypothetical protein
MHFRGLIPGLSLRSNPGLRLANAFGVLQGSAKGFGGGAGQAAKSTKHNYY